VRWLIFLATLWGAAIPARADGPLRVLIRTDKGDIEIDLDSRRAPLTVANFLRYVDAGLYEGGRFHRTVRGDNQPEDTVRIAVIQAGLDPAREKKAFAPIKLERTSKTGLKHRDGTISMARDGPDTATSDFFICVGAQPELDFGGKRNKDGQGFAAFGRVVRGMTVVKKIHAAPAKAQALTPPIRILEVRRLVTPRLVAHRGLLRHAPEDTLAAFAACLELRLGFELDVRRSKDGHLVVIHDATLDRTTNGKGLVAEHSLAELKKLDAGRWFDPAFTGARIPTLEEVFALVKARGQADTLVAIDLKIDDGLVEGQVVRLAKKHGVLARLVMIGTTISSSSVRQRLRAADEGAPAAVLALTAADLPRALAEKEASWVYLRFVPTAEQVKQARRAGKKVFLSGKLVAGREPKNWRAARSAGVDALLTDHPLACRRSYRDKE
jgi:glycerophosphoryl diester phosphodiesterase/cyclophilin family peptidyl-prolyl cis-trans isomerase